MAEIPLSRGKIALVDDVDVLRVSEAGTWSAMPSTTRTHVWYAYRTVYEPHPRTVYLHRFLMDAPRGVLVDHKDGDGLNCRRGNMRLATRSQNCANARHRRTGPMSSQYKGVTRAPDGWRGRICVEKKAIALGTFRTEEAAARAYDDAAERHFGPFAQKNFPIFVPGRGVPGVVQHSLPLIEAERTGHVICPERRRGFYSALRRTSLPALLLLTPHALALPALAVFA